MEPDMERIYRRLEALEQASVRYAALIDEHTRQIDALMGIHARLSHMESMLARLEERLEGLQARMAGWQTIVWALVAMMLGGIVAAGFELLRR